MARLIPQKQIEEINIFKENISVKKSVFISGSLLVSQSIDIGSDLNTPQTITGSVQITGSLEIDGPLSFANANDRLDATASFADESVDTQRFGGILAKEFGESDATLYVSSTNGSDDNDGRTPQFPLRTIKKAAKIATDGDDGRYGLPTGSLFTGFAIKVDTGTYLEDNPIELPKNTTVWGSGLRVTKVLAKNENEDLFWVNSGNYLSEMTFGNLRVFPSVDISEKGFAVAFAPNAFITTSPYVQNCSMISNQENSFLEAYEDIPAGGGGLNVDGNRIHPDSPLASMVLDAYTQIAPNGVGCQVVGRGFIQLVSFFTNFSAYSVKVVDGGQAVLLNSNTSFGDFGMYASGSRFITGSGGNANAFFNVQDNYSIIIDTIKNGLTSIPDLVPTTFEGRRLTDLTDVPQYFISEDSTTDVADRVKSDFRLVSSIVEDGITNVPKLLAKSGKGGYGPESLYNISGEAQYTNVSTASSSDVSTIDTNFDITLDIIDRGNAATSSYVQIDNVSASIKTTDSVQYKTFAVQSDTNDKIKENFDTVISIIENGLTFSPDVSSSTELGYVFTDTIPYETDVTSSLETIQSVSSSFSLVYDILANGTGSLPSTIFSSSIENSSVDVQNAYTLLIENIPFIQDETIAYLSSSWSEHPYNQETCKRDVGFIISSSAHDLLFGGNEESIRSGVFYYQFPSNATTTEKDPTLTGVKYASELAINILDGKVFSDAPAELDNAYDVIYQNKDFVRNETIAYLSSSWSEFEYNEEKCKRDIGYILDAVATDINYGGNERSVIAGEFYHQYPSLAIVDDRTTGQLQQTLDGIKYAKRITEKLTNNETFVAPSDSIIAAINLIKENRSLIQNETVTYIDTEYPNFSYDRVKCKRDTGYIIDNIATDLLYGGNERSELAGLYYFLYPSIANTTQLEETLEAIRYTKEFTKAIVQSIVLETPQVILNVDGNIRTTTFTPTTSSISATDSEVKIVSQSFGVIEDIIRYGTDSVISSIAGNTDEYTWNLENPLNVSGISQKDSLEVATSSTTNLITSSFDTVIKIIKSGSSIETEETIGTDSKGTPISTVGIPKNSYGDNLVKTTIGTTIPSDITLVKNTEEGIKFGSDVQITSSISADLTNVTKISSSFSTVSNIIKYGISGSLDVSGLSDASTYFEVVSLYDGSFSINKKQTQKFDDVDGKILGEDTGSFDDSVKDPTLTLKRGDLYTFSINSLNIVNAISIETQPFIISTNRSTDTKFRYNEGITNNGSTFGTMTFIVPFDAPDRLFYVNGNDVNASGVINIVDELPLSDTQRYVEVPSIGSVQVVTNNVDAIKVSDIEQYNLSYTASLSESNEISSSFATTIDILKNGVGSFTPTTATYNPADGEFVMNIPQHGLEVGDRIYLEPESFVFTCDMDGNRTEHKLPSVGQPAYDGQLTINSITDNTISVNVGKSGPNIKFNPTNASYDPATGEFTATVGKHTLSVGEGIVLSNESFAFTCDMDDDQSVKSYPRVGIDPFAVRSIPITSVTDTTLTFNVGASGPNKYFTPTDADYNASTGDMVVTVGQHGLGVGRSVVLENESFTFTCDQDGDSTTHSYPRLGSDPFAGKSIPITSVGFTEHTPTNAPYNAASGVITLTIAGHGFSNGDYVKVDDNSLSYTCVLDGNVVEKSYPRVGYDYPSGRWLSISNVTTNTFDINIGTSSYTSAHTFVSATTGGIKRQSGTFTINVGDAGSAKNSIHTFVSALNNAVKHEPQSLHTFVSASNSAIQHLPQSNHTFVRTTTNSVSKLPIVVENVNELIKVTNTTQYTSSVSPQLGDITSVSSSFAVVIDVLENGIGYTPTNATYNPSNGEFVMTIPNHNYSVSDSIYLRPESFTFTCDMDNNKTEHNLPSIGQIAYTDKLFITSLTDDTITVNVGKSGPNVEFTPTTASYDPATGDFVMTVESHSLSVGEGIIMDVESFAFTCDMDNDQSVKSYPRLGIDPYAGRSMKITSITDTTMTVNVGASGPNKFFTPTNADYNALTGDMILTVSESFGLGVGRSVVLENESIAFTCDMDGNATTHSYPRSGSDPYAEQSIIITSVGTTSHSVTDAPYNASNGDVTITIANHNFNNGDYIKLSDNSLTYTCVLDGNTTQKSYPRTGIDYPSGRWLEISNVTTNTFDINIGSSPYTAAHTFVSATTNGLERQDGTFTINVGDAGSASGSIHTFVSSSNEAVKHLPQSIHTFVSASNGAVKHLPQSTHTFVRTTENSVSSLPNEISNVENTIKVTDVSQYISSSVSGTLENIEFISSSVSIVYDIVRSGISGSYTPTMYDTGSGTSTDESTIAAYEIIKNNIPFIQSETLAYLSSSWSTSSYDEDKCARDIGLIISGAAEDLIWNTTSASVVNGTFYLEYPSQAETSQLNQTLDGIEYASKLTQKLIQNIEFTNPTIESSTTHDLLLDNKLFIQNETIEYISSSWSDFNYSEGLCRRDIGHIIDAAATDALYGGNERSVQAASFYYSNPSSATGSQLNQTVDAIDYARRLSNEIIQSNVLSLPSLQTLQVAELVTQNRSLIQEETIQFLSSSWSTFEYNEAKCRRDTGYIIDAVVTDFVYGGNERTVNAGEFYYLYPSDATGSQLTQTVDGIEYAQRLTNKLINNITLVSASIERQTAHSLLFDNKNLIQNEVISFMSSSWSDFEYDDIKCKRDVGYVIDAVATDVLYGGNQRSVVAGEFYYLYPSEATTTQSDQTITGILHAAGLANKIVQNTLLVNASSEKISAYNTILDNKKLVQHNVTEFIDQLYPYFTYDRVKCRRDTGYIIDAVATDLLWGGNERSIVAGDYYYRYPSQTTSLELTETTTAIEYAKVLVNKLITNIQLGVPSIVSNTNNTIKFNNNEQYTGSLSISGSNITEISSSFEMVGGIINDGIKTFTPTSATYNPADGEFVMTIPNHTLTTSNGLYLKPESFVFTCDMDGNRSEHKLPAAGQPAYNSRLGIQSVTSDTISVNVGKSGPNINFNPTTASYDPATGDFVVNVGTHSLSVGEGIVMEPESFAFTCDMDDNDSTKSYPRVGIDPFAVRSIPITSVTDTTLTFNVGASGPNKYFTPTDANYNGLTGDMVVTVGQHGLGVGRSVVLENTSLAFTCDMDSNSTTHSYPRLGSDPYAGKSIPITSVGTTQHTVSFSTYIPSSGLVSLTITEHGFSNGDYIKLSDNSLTFSCLLDGNIVGKSYPRAGVDYPSGRWLEISNVTTDTFEINIGTSSYDTPHTFVSAVSNGLERQTGTFTINVGDAGSASGSIHTFVSSSTDAIKHEPQSVHTFVSASNGALKHLPQSNHTFKRTDGNSVSTLPYEVRNVDSLTKVTNATQITLDTSASETEVGIISASINMINDIIRLGSENIPFSIAKNFQTSELDTPQNLTTSTYVTASGTYTIDDELQIVTDSFTQINDIITNGTNSLPTLVSNVNSNIKVTSTNQYTSSITGSSIETSIVNERAGLIENIVTNGVSVIPTIIDNNVNIDNLIKVGNVEQYVSASGADKIQSKILSSSFGLVINGLTNGTGSLPTISDYTTNVDAPKTVLAYNLVKENIDFIKEETILFMSSSWSTFVYDEEKCRRDVGLIVSGAVEDLIWNSNSASVVNTKFYYEYPSDATGSQLEQTVTAIKYAGNLVQNIVRNYEYTTASAEVSSSYNLLIENREFIQNETIEFVSSSWSDFEYPELTCKRDVGYIIDAVATDLLYGGTERSSIAGRYYYDYPSAAIVGGVPSVSQQKDPTVTAINYVKGLVTELVDGSVFITQSNEVDYVYDSIRLNREFIQSETVAFVNAKYPNLQYNEVSCSRDTGFIVDAVATDLRYGGNQRALTAGEFYYRFPSKATNVQLGETIDAIVYASDLVEEIVLKNTLTIPTLTENVENNIKVTPANQTLGTGTTEISVLNAISSSFGIVMGIVQDGTGSLPTTSEYTASISDSDTLEAYSLLKSNIPFIQSETIAYISSSWNGFDYNEASCSRDVGHIVSGAAEDLLFGSISSSVFNGKFYYDFPSQAQGSQLNQTLDGIRYAGRLANKIVQSVTLNYPSNEASSSWELLRSNREFIQSESISYISSSWSSFEYNEETCKRDVGHIIDAISTDIIYGGNERSVNAGDFYYRYPSNATTSELEPTTTGIEYAGDLAEKIIVNEILTSPSVERIAGNKTILENREFIQNEVISYISSSWSGFEYNEASCSRDTGYIIDAVVTDFLYGGNERSRTAGEFYYKYPSSATVAGVESPTVDAQLYPTLDGIKYASGISQKLIQNTQFVTASNEVSSSWNLLRDNKEFIQNEVIAYVSSSWSGVYYNEDKCKRDVGYLIDAAATDVYYGGNERSVNAGSFYYLFPSSATEKGVPSTTAQLDPTVDGIRYAGKLSTKVIKNETFVQPSSSVLVGADLLLGNKNFIQKETIAFLSSSWSEFEYNEASCSRDLGYIIDAVRTDLVYGGNERSVQAGTFYYYIPSVATTEQKPQTTDGIDFAKGLSEKVILKEQLVRAPFQTRESVDYLRASKKELQSIAISYTNGAFPGFVYNEEKCYRDTGFILDAIATDLYYGGNERSIAAAESYYTGVYGDAAEVITNQQYETADVNRYLRTQFQRVVRNSPLEEFGSLIITTGHDFSYAGSGVTYKALPPNQGGAGIPDPDKEITEIAGGRVFFTSGNELGDFRIGNGLVINQATGTLQGRTFSRSLFSLVTPFSLALEG